jgi:selenium metabolism protein YedF
MFMSTIIDATEKACPIPFMLAKKQIDAAQSSFTVLVDNRAAVENLKRLAASQGYETTVDEDGSNFQVHFHGSEEMQEPEEIPAASTSARRVVYISRDTMGSGAEELGKNLLRMFLYTLSQDANLPESIVMLNSGVYLATIDKQTIKTLQVLSERGVEILVCGTCLDYYTLLDELSVGSICTMYDIEQRLMHADIVITV